MKYENNWLSIASRPVPEWFEDAKFGIFIHWGLYSVPAYAPKKQLAEWYGDATDSIHHPDANEYQKAFREFHKKQYGDNFKYQDFVNMFKAEFFDADEWADLLNRSGAKYMNFVSKHHDGFCMYQTDYSRYWNSYDVGPHRDFCRELKDALDKTDVKFGVYHSIFEWWNPLCKWWEPENTDLIERYSKEHLIPMLKEVIEKYQPWTLFTDGEWDFYSKYWHSTDFLQWLFNESSVKDVIVPNDRWGKETRGVCTGGNMTTEYGFVSGQEQLSTIGKYIDGDPKDLAKYIDGRVSEECRGIGGSFGFNKNENIDDYLSSKELIYMLVDLVSHGNNLLLNIGPTADGRIPVIMQQRLVDIGDWLKINGEAIYYSRRYKESTTENVKYTKSKNGKTIFALFTEFPFGEVVLNEIDYSENIKACILGSDYIIDTCNCDGKLKLVFNGINPNKISSKYVYTVKLESKE